jgi:hypothetical protein
MVGTAHTLRSTTPLLVYRVNRVEVYTHPLRTTIMPKVAEFYSVNETAKPAASRVHHNNSACPPGRDIKAAKEDRPGTGGYRLCLDCDERNKQGK